ncbi:aromatase/cyclase [Catellatospora tritici]|uniref:aromatase/cyclase n=1 Tax=Catellatospora tritici TaxID=2851566 RepID=UPI001C2DE2D8|nr:aromatase/cyclase [Catellatospora tritici]MBV1855591.1 aromatase/cyclase [Catellatospora tritici]
MSHQVRNTVHEITVDAPAKIVYNLLADVTNWPRVFPPTVHIEQVEQDGDTERIRLWATANGEVKTWTSRRTLDPDELRITFRQEVSQPPVASMGGGWFVEQLSEDRSRVVLTHDFTAVGDDPDNIAWIDRAVEHNSTTELASLKAAAEEIAGLDELRLSFEDSLHINGQLSDVYDFINEADRWSERLPHVATVDLREDTPGIQQLSMDTRTADGSTHTTVSVRVCLPPDRIVYKQIKVPALMTLHTGYWQLTSEGDGVTATSQHTVVIKREAVEQILGVGATVADARAYVQKALSANSTATLRHAKAFAEGA